MGGRCEGVCVFFSSRRLHTRSPGDWSSDVCSSDLLCMKCSFGISDFLEEIPSLSHSIVFLYFFAFIAEEGFLISSCYSLKLCIQIFISFLFSFAFRVSSFHSYFKASPDSHFAF